MFLDARAADLLISDLYPTPEGATYRIDKASDVGADLGVDGVGAPDPFIETHGFWSDMLLWHAFEIRSRRRGVQFVVGGKMFVVGT
jgi:hypothetical protein